MSAEFYLCVMRYNIALIDHENRCAEREQAMGHWLSDHSEAVRIYGARCEEAADGYKSCIEKERI